MSDKKLHLFFTWLTSIGKSICLFLGFRSRQKNNPEEAPVAKLVNVLLKDASNKGASEFQIEPVMPYQISFDVKYRIGDDVHTVMRPPHRLRKPMAERIKIMAGFDLAERENFQQGWFDFNIIETGERITFFVSIIPTQFGEKIILKLQR